MFGYFSLISSRKRVAKKTPMKELEKLPSYPHPIFVPFFLHFELNYSIFTALKCLLLNKQYPLTL